jgi:hypothetical protein
MRRLQSNQLPPPYPQEVLALIKLVYISNQQRTRFICLNSLLLAAMIDVISIIPTYFATYIQVDEHDTTAPLYLTNLDRFRVRISSRYEFRPVLE